MGDVIILPDGKNFTVVYDQDVYDVIREYISPDLAEIVKERYEIPPADLLADLTDRDILENGYCTGECEKVQSTQEHYTNLLLEIKELAGEVYNKILEGYQIGGKRTRKEQFALDKVIQIRRIVNKNT